MICAGLLVAGMMGAAPARGQEVVGVGKGSYAATPPGGDKGAREMMGRTFALVERGDRAIPTNKYWTWFLQGKVGGSLIMLPFRVEPKEGGAELAFAKKWNGSGSDPVYELPVMVGGVDFRAGNLKVKDWGDWTLTLRLEQGEGRHLDVTVGEGMPLVWVESAGVELTLKLPKDAMVGDAAGKAAGFPYAGKTLTITAGDRLYGVFLPPGAKVVRNADQLVLQGSGGGNSFVAVGALQGLADVATFAACAYAVPRDSRMDWTYDAAAGKVATTWTVKTEALAAGAGDKVIQGWLPHVWRGGVCGFKLDGPAYLSPRGALKTAVGNGFGVTYDFAGFLPMLPAPGKGNEKPGFDRERMAGMLSRCAEKPKYGDDSYWGGKDLLRFAQYMQMAKELKDPTYEKLREESRASLVDWLTYTPGESAHYFAWYGNWRALVGFKGSYDSEKFNDQHFHYGYLTYSAALLGMEDEAFLKDYGPMLRLVAKEYANWDRKDTRFPVLRTFDMWAGHSYAGGLGSPGGNNQESSSEAMQSWIGLYLLGVMLEDKEMTATGAMGYAMESRATMEYWFNAHGDNLPKEYKHPMVGIVWTGGNAWGTYFTGDPGWIYGIQCLPQSPGLDYLLGEGDFGKKLLHEMLGVRKAKEGSDDLAKMGDLGNVLLAQAALVDPEWAAGEFDRLWEAGSKNIREHFGSGTTYYNTYAYRELGRRQSDVHLSVGTGAAYRNAAGVTTYVAYNGKANPEVVDVRKEGVLLGTFEAKGRSLTRVTVLTLGARK